MSRGTINFGHGQKADGTFDPGSIGSTGLKESDVVKAVGTIVVSELRRLGHTINVIQSGDLWAVVDSSNEFNSDWFVSIHNNSFGDKTAHGIEVHVSALGKDAEKIARAIQSQLISATGLTDRGIKVTGLYVNKYTNCPSCLVELPFISNPTEEALLANPEFQRKCAIAIVKGIQQYLGLEYLKSTSTPSPTPSTSVMFRVVVDGKQISALSSKDLAILTVKELVDSGRYAKGVVQRNTDGVNVFVYVKPIKQKSGKIIFTIYPEDAWGASYLSKFTGIKLVNVNEMTQDIFNNFETIIQIGSSKYNANVTLLLSGNNMYDTCQKVLDYIKTH